MIRTKGEAGTGNVVEAVRHMHNIMGEIRTIRGKTPQECMDIARRINAPADLVIEVGKLGRLPVVNFSAGGIATPSDAALMMHMGADGVFVGSGIFHASNPPKMARAIVGAVNHYDDPKIIAEVSKGLGSAMRGLDVHTLKEDEVLQTRGR
jgi:pyridoxal 5'-phosphate synthase pdxS subunit